MFDAVLADEGEGGGEGDGLALQLLQVVQGHTSKGPLNAQGLQETENPGHFFKMHKYFPWMQGHKGVELKLVREEELCLPARPKRARKFFLSITIVF